MRRNQLQLTILLLFSILLVVSCDQLSDADRERIGQLAEQGQSLAGTAAAVAPTYAATARAAASTAVAAAPTIAVDAQIAAATTAANGRIMATRITESGTDLLGLARIFSARAGTILPDQNGNVSLTISEAELTAVLQRDELQTDRRLQNLAATFGDGRIIITGNVERPVQADFAVVFIPTVVNGEIVLTIQEATIGQIRLPAIIIGQIESRLNSTLNRTVGLIPGNLLLTDIAVGGGQMTVFGRIQ